MKYRNTVSPNIDRLLALVPVAPIWSVDWPGIWSVLPEFAALDDCPQDPVYHAEGDVGTHTRMVVESLVAAGGWQHLPDDARTMLFWAACLHDVGKPMTTKREDDGRITSRGHSRLGASIARSILWKAGADFYWRESLCNMIVHHQLPFWLIERPMPERLAISVSQKCCPELLCLHARADALGRHCRDQESILQNIELAREIFREAGCLSKPFAFANDESRIAFLEREDRDPAYVAHEEFRCEVRVMSALPGSGKDTWIKDNCPELPVVSLDAVRQDMGVSATDNQGQVIQAAYEQAKVHLRSGQDFVWNATNVTAQTRSKVLRLLRDYNAKIHIIYVEVPPDQLRRQNEGRNDPVPIEVIEKLTKKLEPPDLTEAHQVSYVVQN